MTSLGLGTNFSANALAHADLTCSQSSTSIEENGHVSSEVGLHPLLIIELHPWAE